MNTQSTDLIAYEAIEKTIRHYIDGARTANGSCTNGSCTKAAFHLDAAILGYIGAELFAGPIQKLFDCNEANGPADNRGPASPLSTWPELSPRRA